MNAKEENAGETCSGCTGAFAKGVLRVELPLSLGPPVSLFAIPISPISLFQASIPPTSRTGAFFNFGLKGLFAPLPTLGWIMSIRTDSGDLFRVEAAAVAKNVDGAGAVEASRV
jgi:hypothetical protein